MADSYSANSHVDDTVLVELIQPGDHKEAAQAINAKLLEIGVDPTDADAATVPLLRQLSVAYACMVRADKETVQEGDQYNVRAVRYEKKVTRLMALLTPELFSGEPGTPAGRLVIAGIPINRG